MDPKFFSVPRDALIAFVYHIVRDWRFEHWSSFEHNHIFMKGVECGYGLNENPVTHSSVPSLDGFLMDIEDLLELNNCGSSVDKHIETNFEHSRITQHTNQTHSAASQNLTGGFPRADEGHKLIQRDSKSRDTSLLSMQITQSPQIKSDSESAGTRQTHTWKQISGYGPWVFAYK